MDQELSYPLYISVNLLVVSPNKIRRESTPGAMHQVKVSTDNANENERKVKLRSESFYSSSWAHRKTATIFFVLIFFMFEVTIVAAQSNFFIIEINF